MLVESVELVELALSALVDDLSLQQPEDLPEQQPLFSSTAPMLAEVLL